MRGLCWVWEVHFVIARDLFVSFNVSTHRKNELVGLEGASKERQGLVCDIPKGHSDLLIGVNVSPLFRSELSALFGGKFLDRIRAMRVGLPRMIEVARAIEAHLSYE